MNIKKIDEMYAKMPSLDYAKLNIKKEAKKDTDVSLDKEAFRTSPNYDVINAFLNKEEAKGGQYQQGQRQWSTDGNTLNYWNSLVAYWDNEDIIVSDAGWKTATTRSILNGIFDALNSGLSLQTHMGIWFLSFQGKQYKWTGTVRIPAGGISESTVLTNEEGQELQETNTREIERSRRQLTREVENDVKAIEQAMLEQGTYDVDLLNVLNTEKYGEGIDTSLFNFMYNYYTEKGDGDPSYVIYGIKNAITSMKVNEIKNIAPTEKGRYLIEFTSDAPWGGEQELNVEMDESEMQELSVEDLINKMNQKPELSRSWDRYRNDLKDALRKTLDKKRVQEETGREYEAIR